MTESAERLDYASGINRQRDGFANGALLAVVVLFAAVNVTLYQRQVRSLLRLSAHEVALACMAGAPATVGAVYVYHRRSRRTPRPLNTAGVTAVAVIMQVPIVANYAVLATLDSVRYSAGPKPWVRVLFVAAFLALVWLGGILALRRRAHPAGEISYNS